MNMVALQQDTVTYFLNNPSIDGSMVYREVWPDREGLFICMYPAQGTLRRFITAETQLGADEWFQILYGITRHLAPAHEIGLIHRDLKPSNSISPCFGSTDFIVLVD